MKYTQTKPSSKTAECCGGYPDYGLSREPPACYCASTSHRVIDACPQCKEAGCVQFRLDRGETYTDTTQLDHDSEPSYECSTCKAALKAKEKSEGMGGLNMRDITENLSKYFARMTWAERALFLKQIQGMLKEEVSLAALPPMSEAEITKAIAFMELAVASVSLSDYYRMRWD